MQPNIIDAAKQYFNGNTYYLCGRYYANAALRPRRLHRAVWVYHNGTIPKGMHVHHKDNDRSNNHAANLELKTSFTHLSEHMTPQRRVLARKHAERIRPLTKAWHRSAEGRLWHVEHARKVYAKRAPADRECSHCHKTFFTTQLGIAARFCHANCKMKARTRRLRGLPEDAKLA